MSDEETLAMQTLLSAPLEFIRQGTGIRLRAYQREVALAVIDSVLRRRGLRFVVVFPRQSGKNELQAQIEAYLLAVLHGEDAEMVKVSPTWKPQSLNAMRRLKRVLEKNTLTRGRWGKEHGYIFRLGRARALFFSGEPTSHIVGATASTLLQVDEAQDVGIEKYDKEIAPMAASTNATRVFWGTAWTSQTLLARELRAARAAEQSDGVRRAWVLNAEAVSAEVPAYGRFVAEQVARLGRSHPLVRTQFFSEEIDGGGGMFPPERIARTSGTHLPLDDPRPGATYALLLDVAGEDEAAGGDPTGQAAALANPRRDATALTVVSVTPAPAGLPVYRCVARRQWVGVRHAELFQTLLGLAHHWSARRIVIDATGVGAGLASFLSRALPGRVIPFTFSAASKSKLGWDFLALVDAGRWQEPAAAATRFPVLTADFQRQLTFCQYEVLPGPERHMRWGVPDGTRDPASGELLHDDLLISAALATVLDGLPWAASGPAGIVRARDPLEEMDGKR